MNTERSFFRKTVDKIALGVSFFTLPFSLVAGVSAVGAAELLKAGGAFTWSFLDVTQIREHGRKPEEQSWYNPERIMDRVIGSLRFNKKSRLAYSNKLEIS